MNYVTNYRNDSESKEQERFEAARAFILYLEVLHKVEQEERAKQNTLLLKQRGFL